MGFKSDREFLRNVSIGAIGTRQVAAVLERGGFRIIELERYSSSNKIWATKIKRLRVPDLLCLRTGIRIESRGKSALEVTMSHAVNNPDRAWDKGLRDGDLIAFVKCWPVENTWRASDRVSLFRVGDMRARVDDAGLSRMKSSAEGSEIRLTWPATIPGTAGQVVAVSSERIETELISGRKQTYRLVRKDKHSLVPCVKAGDEFGDGDTIIASIMPAQVPNKAPKTPQFDFLADLRASANEDVYVAVKALGHLPEFANRSVPKLLTIARSHADGRIKLEAAASLARLGKAEGWAHLEATALDSKCDTAYRMESALILAELPGQRSIDLLTKVATNAGNESELRAAAVWGLSAIGGTLPTLLPLTHDPDETTAVHAIIGSSRLIKSSNVAQVLQAIDTDNRQAAGLVRAVLSSKCDFLPELIRQLQSTPSGPRRQWLLYLAAAAGQAKCERFFSKLPAEIRATLEFFWTHHADNWTNRLDVADQIDFSPAATDKVSTQE